MVKIYYDFFFYVKYEKENKIEIDIVWLKNNIKSKFYEGLKLVLLNG